jgi:hypothetical protein
MARAGLKVNRKFIRLATQLGAIFPRMGELIARGALETMWDHAYERADEHLGDAEDVECAARWQGDRGVLLAMLLGCGGEGRPGFVEPDPARGGYRVHDLWQHAPPWVRRKLASEERRRIAGVSISDLRREAGRQGAAAKKANGKQKVDLFPVRANGSQDAAQGRDGIGTGRDRDGTGRVQTRPPQVAPLELAPGAPDLGKPANAKQRATVDRFLQAALEVLDRLNVERMRVIPGTRKITPSYSALSGIAGRLESGFTVADCQHVVTVRAAEVRTDPSSAKWFDSVSPWREENFRRYLDRVPSRATNVMDPGSESDLEEKMRHG